MQNTLDLAVLGLGLVLLTIYFLFAFFVTRHGDFYKTRRWKAAIWTSLLSAFLFVAIIIISLGGMYGINSPFLNTPNLSFVTFVINLFQLFKSAILSALLYLLKMGAEA